jgi:nicotinamidase/pyrazinamidase
MRALILVDIQNDFLPGGSLAVPGGDEVIAVANRLMPNYDLVVATQDWHPPTHRSFAVNHPGRETFEVIEWQGAPQVLWPEHCVQESAGADFPAGLDRSRIQHVVAKGVDPDVDSYSAFFDNARQRATGLEDWLRQHGVDEVHLVGLATDYCVRATALDAVRLGFRTVVFRDGCRGVNQQPGDSDRAFAEMTEQGVIVTDSSASPATPVTMVHRGKHLSFVARGTWEFVTRNTQRPAVGIVAITRDERVLLVEQRRPAVNEPVIELPAGLVGDSAGSEHEPLLLAAQRELLEETGYEAARWTELVTGYSSPGLTDEAIVLFLAEELSRVNAGGGVEAEQITVHEVPLPQVLSWLEARGARADLKLLAGLYAASELRRQRSQPG